MHARLYIVAKVYVLSLYVYKGAEVGLLRCMRSYNRTIDAIASRLTTVFTALHELPSIRYHAPKAASAQQTASEAARARLAQRVASGVHARMSELHSLPGIPVNEVCVCVTSIYV